MVASGGKWSRARRLSLQLRKEELMVQLMEQLQRMLRLARLPRLTRAHTRVLVKMSTRTLIGRKGGGMKPGQEIGKHSGKRTTKAQMQANFVLFQAACPAALPEEARKKGFQLSALKKQFNLKFINPSGGTPARVSKI
jgi:hypothetical protein